MDATFTDDDVVSDEELLDRDRLLREHGIRRDEISDEEADELIDDIRSDGADVSEDDDMLSDVVTDEENDGND